MTRDTLGQEHKLSDAIQVAKLLRMLRSMSRRFPQAKLARHLDGFGVSLGGGKWLQIRCNGDWTDEDLRDFLALYATWLVVDGPYLRGGGQRLAGVFAEVQTLYGPSSMPTDLELNPPS